MTDVSRWLKAKGSREGAFGRGGDPPGRGGQNAAGRSWSCDSGSQGTHLLSTQRQRSPGPAAAHGAAPEKARQDGGV